MANPHSGGKARGAGCPVCGRPSVTAWRPFCSKACADIDLGRWLGGAYAIPGAPAAPEDLAGAAGAGDATNGDGRPEDREEPEE